MKRLFAIVGMLGVLAFSVVIVNAGAPKEQPLAPQGEYYNTQIMGSSATTANVGVSLTIAPPAAVNSGGTSYNFQNCFTRFIVQMSTCSLFTYQDGTTATSTTTWSVYGAGLGTASPSTISLPEDHLGPICSQFGNSTILTISTSTISTTQTGTGSPCVGASNIANSAINYEGFTTAGVGSTANAGK